MKKAPNIQFSPIKTVFLIALLFVQHKAICQSNEPTDFAELSKQLSQKFSNEFAFSVLIGKDGIEVFHKNFGHTDQKRTTPVSENTLFNIASISKSITAVGIMKLVKQHKINLEDSLGRYFENVPNSMESIQIKTLLGHSSGFKQNYPLEGVVDSDDALTTIFQGDLAFAPGSKFLYSNQNYQLLALIIEKVTQVNFEEFISKEILHPLGMTNTYFWDQVDDANNIANPGKKITRKIGTRNWGWIAATGIFTTVRDLSKFWNGINNENFLSEPLTDVVFNNHYETPSGLQIGYGFYKTPKTKWNTPEIWTRGTESWGHNGVIRYFPERKTTVIILTNSGEFGKNKMTGNKVIGDLVVDYLLK